MMNFGEREERGRGDRSACEECGAQRRTRDGRWRATVVIVVESTQQRDSSRHAATATDFEAHPPPSLAVRRLSEDRAARSLTRGPSGPARGILTGWGFPHCVRETSLTRPTDRLCGPVSGLSYGRHTHTSHTGLPHTPVPDLRTDRARAACYSRKLLLVM